MRLHICSKRNLRVFVLEWVRVVAELRKETKKSNKKDSQLIIRINGEEREQFVQLCEELDTSAAREVRHFIRDFIKNRSGDT